MALSMKMVKNTFKKHEKFTMKLFNLLFFLSALVSLLFSRMSCDDLFKYALDNSPTIRIAILDVDLADQQIKQALTAGYPKINGSLSFQNFIDIPTTVVPANAFDPTAPVMT